MFHAAGVGLGGNGGREGNNGGKVQGKGDFLSHGFSSKAMDALFAHHELSGQHSALFLLTSSPRTTLLFPETGRPRCMRRKERLLRKWIDFLSIFFPIFLH
jgi:hypothetical protein